MTTRTRWPLAVAEVVARDLVGYLADACQRLEIAGSIRRRKPDVGDIELVAISKYTDVPPSSSQLDMFQPAVQGRTTQCLDNLIFDSIQAGVFSPRLDARGRQTVGPLNKLLIHVESGIPVDIFTATPSNWGMTLFVRTGPAEWNIRAMAAFKRQGMRGHAYGGVSLGNGREVPCPTEQSVFDLLGWPWAEPQDRA